MKNLVILVISAILLISTVVYAEEEKCGNCHPGIVANYTTSLHYTGEGMPAAYNQGAAGYFGIDMDSFYDEKNCAKCHATSCYDCHSLTPHNEDTANEIETCDKCHMKKQATFSGFMPKYSSEGPSADIHFEAGFNCMDCHTSTEIHGDGEVYTDMTEAVKVECEDCHSQDLTIEAHATHENELDCAACHMAWMPTCVNCHLDTMKTDEITIDKFYLMRAGDGEIKPFLQMISSIGEDTHISYSEYFAHTVTDEPHDCEFCHENRERFEVEPGQMLGPKGAHPVTEETLDRIFPNQTWLEELYDWLFE